MVQTGGGYALTGKKMELTHGESLHASGASEADRDGAVLNNDGNVTPSVTVGEHLLQRGLVRLDVFVLNRIIA